MKNGFIFLKLNVNAFSSELVFSFGEFKELAVYFCITLYTVYEFLLRHFVLSYIFENYEFLK